MRRKILLVVVFVLFSATTGQAWFGYDEQIIKVEQQLHEQRQNSSDWMVIAGILSIGCTILFRIGSAIGSKARKAVKKDE